SPQSGLRAPSTAQRALWPRSGPAQKVCGAPARGTAECASWIRTDVNGKPAASAPSGYGPSDLQTAYNIATAAASSGAGVTVAIVDAFDDPNAESDLGVYRSQFGLSPCTTANGCFSKVKLGNRTNTGWGEEESLDVDMVSAICPNCHILLVEAASNSTSNLTNAEDYATAHANYVSNSWSGNEGSASSTDSHYQIAGKVVTAATGDSGYNATAQWPAILPGVIGVGGTSLNSISPRSETAWSGAGSGCSKVYAKPSFQSGINTGCSMRAQADVSAIGDPNTGVAVYDTFRESGWLVFGGTSVATPIIASVYALSGNTDNATFLYGHASSLYDVTSGSNGSCGAPLCTSGSGWDGPTGEGTPNGLGAF
ncbi:MAG TPA: S53 family peptidase, partial [Candidatus Baltobacteraceae bacterium]|nr:S53 family peptidase [Candidatus Baltobacteraceae bacterium]